MALARIKRSAALVNKQLGIRDGAVADSIVLAADEIVAGRHHDQFPVDTYQTGSGTSSNIPLHEKQEARRSGEFFLEESPDLLITGEIQKAGW